MEDINWGDLDEEDFFQPVAGYVDPRLAKSKPSQTTTTTSAIASTPTTSRIAGQSKFDNNRHFDSKSYDKGPSKKMYHDNRDNREFGFSKQKQTHGGGKFQQSKVYDIQSRIEGSAHQTNRTQEQRIRGNILRDETYALVLGPVAGSEWGTKLVQSIILNYASVPANHYQIQTAGAANERRFFIKFPSNANEDFQHVANLNNFPYSDELSKGGVGDKNKTFLQFEVLCYNGSSNAHKYHLPKQPVFRKPSNAKPLYQLVESLQLLDPSFSRTSSASFGSEIIPSRSSFGIAKTDKPSDKFDKRDRPEKHERQGGKHERFERHEKPTVSIPPPSLRDSLFSSGVTPTALTKTFSGAQSRSKSALVGATTSPTTTPTVSSGTTTAVPSIASSHTTVPAVTIIPKPTHEDIFGDIRPRDVVLEERKRQGKENGKVTATIASTPVDSFQDKSGKKHEKREKKSLTEGSINAPSFIPRGQQQHHQQQDQQQQYQHNHPYGDRMFPRNDRRHPQFQGHHNHPYGDRMFPRNDRRHPQFQGHHNQDHHNQGHHNQGYHNQGFYRHKYPEQGNTNNYNNDILNIKRIVSKTSDQPETSLLAGYRQSIQAQVVTPGENLSNTQNENQTTSGSHAGETVKITRATTTDDDSLPKSTANRLNSQSSFLRGGKVNGGGSRKHSLHESHERVGQD